MFRLHHKRKPEPDYIHTAHYMTDFEKYEQMHPDAPELEEYWYMLGRYQRHSTQTIGGEDAIQTTRQR